MSRFFLPRQALQGGFAVLTGESAAHAKVLRLRRGDSVTVCDGEGRDYRCTVSDISPGQVCLVVHDSDPAASEPALRVSVFMAFAKADKLEHVIQKATELGAHEIVAFPSVRCVSRPEEKPKKLERWQRIAASAAEQSGRGFIPQVSVAASFEEALRLAAEKDFSALLYEDERVTSFRSRVTEGEFATAALMTGPEGGFAPDEVTMAKEAGLFVCSLGPRILRCETAPLCALTALLFARGELD